MKQLRSGDRFRWIDDGSIWEYTHTENECDWSVCIEPNNRMWEVGDKDWWGFRDDDFWEYLGNFSKSANFNTLFDKLNNKCN